jgi:hypothetical protein
MKLELNPYASPSIEASADAQERIQQTQAELAGKVIGLIMGIGTSATVATLTIPLIQKIVVNQPHLLPQQLLLLQLALQFHTKIILKIH